MPVDEQQKKILMKRFEDLDAEGVKEKLDYITWLYGWHLALETLVRVIAEITEQKKVIEVDIEGILKSVFENTSSESSGYSHVLEHISKCPDSHNFDDVLNWVQKSKIGHPTRSKSIEKRKTSPEPKTSPKPRKKERIKMLQELVEMDKFEDITTFVSTHIGEFGWNETKEVLTSSIKDQTWHQQHILVQYLFNLEFLDGIDVAANELLTFESANTTYDAVRDDILNHASDLLDTQFKNNGSTLFFDVDVLIKTGFAHHIPEIIKLRRSQFLWAYKRYIANVDLGLENLLLTHYGNMLLGTLKVIPPRKDLNKLLKKIVAEIKGKSVYDRDLPIQMSKEFENLAFMSASRSVKGELGYDIRRVEFGFSHLPSAFNVLDSNLDEYDLYIGNKDTFALREQAIQILESDKSEESTEYLIRILESLEVSNNEHDTIYTYPYSSKTWERVIQVLITRNCENRIVSKLESVLNQMYKYYYPYGSEVYTIAAKYLADIQGDDAYSLIWSKVVSSGYSEIRIYWDLLDVILSIGPSIKDQLWNDLFDAISEHQYNVEASLALVDYLEKLVPSSWPTGLVVWRFDEPKISLHLIEYFAKHDRNRALRELCGLFGISDSGEKDIEYCSTCVQSIKIDLTEDEIATFVHDDDGSVQYGALTCLVAFHSENGDNILEKLMNDKNIGGMTQIILAKSGNESQIFKVIDFLVNSSIPENELHSHSYIINIIQYRLKELGDKSIKKLVRLHDSSTGIARTTYSFILEGMNDDYHLGWFSKFMKSK